MSKKIPNPDGKKGGVKHQEKIKEVAEDIEKRNLEVDFEHFVRTTEGVKNRFADLAGFDKETGELKELHQIGKQNKNGSPVKREREAISDIENSLKVKVIFHPYNLILLFLLGSFLYFRYFF